MSQPPEHIDSTVPASVAVRCLPCCTGCGACVAACPQRALSLATDQPNGRGQKRAVVDAARCDACGLCLPVCPRQALVMPAPLWTLP